MYVVYSKDNCPACEKLKYKLRAEGKEFVEKRIGKDITLEDFKKNHPDVRIVPYMVEEGSGYA